MMIAEPADDSAIIDASVRLSDGVFSWCVRNASKQTARGLCDPAIQWAIIAGEVADYFCSSKLADETLEAALRELGKDFESAHPPPQDINKAPLRWLHVLSRCYETGGHTALCRRWMELDSSEDIHSVALTFQGDLKIPEALRNVVKNRGGDFHLLDSFTVLTDRAIALKRLASRADVVVLHTHMWEPLTTLAFATPDGPPVLLLNHADHTYWTGASVADLILNLRPSGEALCQTHRGNSRTYRLPIPIPRPDVVRGDPRGDVLRGALSIPTSAPLFLTVGSAYKYIPTKEMNFLESARNILDGLPAGYLVAVGPKPNDPLWQELARQTGGRAIAVGEKTDLKPYFAAADVYLEGFPFGSLTALLEAVLAGIPPILAPECCPLPYRSDDFALNAVAVPKDTNQYVQMAAELGSHTTIRSPASSELRRLAIKIHCEPDWSQALLELRKIIIAGLQHDPAPLEKTGKLSESVIRYWARFSRQRRGQDNVFGYAFRRAMEEGLHPSLDLEMFQTLSQAKNAGLKVASPAKSYFGSAMLSLLPAKMATSIYLRV
jgi:hypothetical protein